MRRSRKAHFFKRRPLGCRAGRRLQENRLSYQKLTEEAQMMQAIKGSMWASLPAAMLASGLIFTPAQAQDGVIRIGITLRMVVENGLKYGQMAKDELEAVNAAGGVNGKKLEVILLDDECKPDKGIANVNRFIHQHKVHLVLGSTCSSVSLPMVEVTAKEEVPQIVPHSTNANMTEAGREWVFHTWGSRLL